MPYIPIHFLWFFLPGFLVLYLFGVRRAVFLLSLATSYSLMILTLLTLIPLGANPVWFSRLLYAELIILLTAAAIKMAREKSFLENAAVLLRRSRKRLPSILIVSTLVGLFGVYWLYAGPYTEIPADFWAHLSKAQYFMSRIPTPEKFWTDVGLLTLISRQDLHWYFIMSWLCKQSGVGIESAYSQIMFSNSVIFLLGIFSFGLFLFKKWRFSRTVKTLMAAAASLFCFTHLGVIVFSYIRYYAMGPAILNHVVFLAALVVWLKVLEGGWREIWMIFFLPFFMLVLMTVHSQEALFAATMFPLASLTSAAYSLYKRENWRSPALAKAIITFCLTAVIWCALFFWLRHTKSPSDSYSHNLVALANHMPFSMRGVIIYPVVALEVITFWGLFVYFVFFLKVKMFIKSPLITAGMLVPFATYFNPFFIDMFLRYHLSGASIIYRMGYIVPLSFVAGPIMVKSVKNLFTPFISSSLGQTLFKKALNIITITALLALLLPIFPVMSRQSRLPTLRRVPPENSHELWNDLCAFLRDVPQKYVFTDTVTSYVIDGMTHHRVRTRRFDEFASFQLFVETEDTPINEISHYLTPSLEWLIIVNRRDGGISIPGAFSTHWPADILKVSKKYPDFFVKYLNDKPDLFVKIWERDGVEVYEYKPSVP